MVKSAFSKCFFARSSHSTRNGKVRNCWNEKICWSFARYRKHTGAVGVESKLIICTYRSI